MNLRPKQLAGALALSLALLLPATVATASGHHGGGGPVVSYGVAPRVSAPARQFYGGFGIGAPANPGYIQINTYDPTTYGYPYYQGAVYQTQPTGAYVPGMMPHPVLYGASAASYLAAYGFQTASYAPAGYYPVGYGPRWR